jgi:hypothetical protein
MTLEPIFWPALIKTVLDFVPDIWPRIMLRLCMAVRIKSIKLLNVTGTDVRQTSYFRKSHREKSWDIESGDRIR